MFESVVSTNFDAVALLRYGRYEESIFLSKVALAAVHSTGSRLPFAVSGRRASVSSVALEDCSGNLCSGVVISEKSTSCFGIFTRGFIFEGALPLDETDANVALCASVCLYNMALSIHLKGLQSGGPSYLRKAAGLYEKVFTILSSYAPAPTESTTSLFLASVLNLIACQGEVSGHTSTTPWVNIYRDLYIWATQSVIYPAILNKPDDFDFFTTNAVLLTNQNLATAAAA